MERRPWALAAAALALALLPAAGCALLLPKTNPPQFFVLSADEPGGSGEALPIALGVGPVQLPGYLDRPQIATRSGPNTIAYSESHRWATPLQQGVADVLMVDLGRRLHTDRITAFPFALGLPRDYDVSVEFLHFEPAADGGVLVEALWRIRDAASGEERVVRQTSLSRTGPPRDAAAAAGALSAALGDLADEIAAALRSLGARHGLASGAALTRSPRGARS